MATVAQVARNFRALNLMDQVVESLEATGPDAVKLNQGQLWKGTDSKNEQLQPYRSATYAAMKAQMNPNMVTDLKLTGSFWGAMYAQVRSGLLEFWSKNEKTASLTKKYGTDIFGLTPESKAEFISRSFWPELKKRIIKIVKIEF